MPSLARRKVLIGVAITVVAVVGALIVLYATGTLGGSDSDASSSSPPGSSSNSTSPTPTSGGSSTPSSGSGSGNTTTPSPAPTLPKIDPTTQKYTLNTYAIGDWGTTIGRDSCCKRRGDHTPTNVDKNAEDVVAALMGKAASETDVKPKVVLGQGDNFYWVGIIDKTDQAYRFQNTFEAKFNAESLSGIPWVNVMGNHDYGGASYICASGGDYVPCKSKEEVLQALNDKFTLQSTYTSENQNRWIMKDHFFVHSVEDEASGVSIDIFNMDTNDASVHGAEQICCQCYGYSNGADSVCKNIVRGDAACMGGNTDWFDACMGQLKAWGEDSREQLKTAVAASKATWKIVNTHYSPYNHYAEADQKMWWDMLKGLGVQLWVNGHTHGEKHDWANIGMHFLENGAGGGILNEAASPVPEYSRDIVEQLWAYPTHDYGFFELKASKEYIKATFMTYDGSWNVADDFKQSTIGGVLEKYCWYIPVDGSRGVPCNYKETATDTNAAVRAGQ